MQTRPFILSSTSTAPGLQQPLRARTGLRLLSKQRIHSLIFVCIRPYFIIPRFPNSSLPDPPVYPHIQLYPVLQGNQLAPEHPSTGRARKVRKTHRELCEIVFSERPVPPRKARQPRKTHEQLRQIVFSELTSPSGLQVPPHTERKASDYRLISDLASVPEDSISPQDVISPEDRLVTRSLRPRLDIASAQITQEPKIRRSTSLRQSSAAPLQAGADLPRSHSLRGPRPLPTSLDNDEVSPTKGKSRRDSIVLEKARLWGAQGEFM